jgi:hypothetical protein
MSDRPCSSMCSIRSWRSGRLTRFGFPRPIGEFLHNVTDMASLKNRARMPMSCGKPATPLPVPRISHSTTGYGPGRNHSELARPRKIR